MKDEFLIVDEWLPFEIHRLPQEKGEHVRIVLAQHVSFLNKASILRSLNTIPDEAKVHIDGTQSVYVHADVIEIIDSFAIGAKERDIDVRITGLEHHQKGEPGAGAEVTVTLPEQPEQEGV